MREDQYKQLMLMYAELKKEGSSLEEIIGMLKSVWLLSDEELDLIIGRLRIDLRD